MRLFMFLILIMMSNVLFSASLNLVDAMKLTSLDFKNNGFIPNKYSCHGGDISPELQWKYIPNKTVSLVLIMEDPEAPMGIWDHWILFNIPKNTTQLPENLSVLPGGAQYGKNSWGKLTYRGPCPPNGEHRYVFTVYALDIQLNLSNGVSKKTLQNAMRGHILASATLSGRYKVNNKIHSVKK